MLQAHQIHRIFTTGGWRGPPRPPHRQQMLPVWRWRNPWLCNQVQYSHPLLQVLHHSHPMISATTRRGHDNRIIAVCTANAGRLTKQQFLGKRRRHLQTHILRMRRIKNGLADLSDAESIKSESTSRMRGEKPPPFSSMRGGKGPRGGQVREDMDRRRCMHPPESAGRGGRPTLLGRKSVATTTGYPAVE
jgi:hypothetical protein